MGLVNVFYNMLLTKEKKGFPRPLNATAGNGLSLKEQPCI